MYGIKVVYYEYLRMSNLIGFIALSLVLLLDLSPSLGWKCGGMRCKVNEHSSIPVDLPRLCGNRIMDYYSAICVDTVWAKGGRKRG